MELVFAYLMLGGLAALANGDRRVRDLARTILIWPAVLPKMVSMGRPDPPGLVHWEGRIEASISSLRSVIASGQVLDSAEVGVTLLEDTQQNLLGIARRHAELDVVLQAPENDLRAARDAVQGAAEHRLPVLRRRVSHIEQLYAAREALETRLEAGMAEAMNLAARLNIARATDAPIASLEDTLQELAGVVDGVEEVQLIGGTSLSESLPLSWEPQLAEMDDAEELAPMPTRDAASEAEKLAFEETFSDAPAELPAIVPSTARSGQGASSSRSARLTLLGSILALALGSIFYRVLVFGALEQTAALFIGLPTLLAAVVAMLPPARSYTGTMFKIMTLMLLLSGVLLAEGFICILMAAPLFYLVALSCGILLDLLPSQRAGARVMVFVPLLLLSVEGVSDDLSAERSEEVTVTRTVAASPDEVAAALAARPDFSEALPFYLRLGFPRPVRALGSGLALGDRRLVHFAGGEGQPGDLLLEVWSTSPSRVLFGVVSDTSHVAHWLTWKNAEVSWEAVAPSQTRVTWTLRYDRELDPMVWFKPTERYAVSLATGYLMDSLLPPGGPHATP